MPLRDDPDLTHAQLRLRRVVTDLPPALNWVAGPTPVQRYEPWCGAQREVWVKRDDASSPIYGGGKVRKLEWILGAPPYDTDVPVLSVGGIGSHHLVALALFLAQQDRSLHGLVFEQERTAHVRRNLATLVQHGARLEYVRSRAALPLAWWNYRQQVAGADRGRYMEPGASTPPGCLGFVAAAVELTEQVERGELPRPAHIFVTAGTAGTAAGLALGFAMMRFPVQLHLVSSVERWAFNRFMFMDRLGKVWKLLRRLRPHDPGPRSAVKLLRDRGVLWSIDHSQVGARYGSPTEAGLDALADARTHGLHLDATYTAKCAAALIRAKTIEGPVVYWNTHGATDLSPHDSGDWVSKLPEALRAGW